MVAKIMKRLVIWKVKFISLVGRVCVIKSVLSAMSLFLYQSSNYHRLSGYESFAFREISYGARDMKIVRLPGLVGSKDAKSKNEGELRMLELKSFNKELLEKWK